MLIQQIVDFITDPANEFATHTLVTLEYTFIPIVLCVLIAIPLGVLVAPNPVAAFLAANVSGAARAIPTIAFLAAAIPLLGIGFTPTIVALTLLGIPPVLLNTVAGLRGVDPAAIEAGRGMGMTARQVLARVQIPLVLPVVAAGVRTAGVQIAATTPLAGLIGGGGYGDYIYTGLLFSLPAGLPALLVGAIGVAALALLTEITLSAVQRAVTPAGLRVTEGQEVKPTGGGGLAEPESQPVAA
jgi:osmoprotectant transport system permease protein